MLTFTKYIYSNSNNKSNVIKINITNIKNDKKHLTIHLKSIINPYIYIYIYIYIYTYIYITDKSVYQVLVFT